MRSVKTRTGFTLTEMLVALGVMVLAVSIAVPVLMTSRARTRRVDAVNAVRAALASARQSAVQRRTVVAVEFVEDTTSATRGDRMFIVDKSLGITDEERVIGSAIELPEFIKFESDAPDWTLENGWDGDPQDLADTPDLLDDSTGPYPDIAYRPDGTAADPQGTTSIVLIDTTEGLRTVLMVLPVTGLVIEPPHLQDPALPEGPGNPMERGWL